MFIRPITGIFLVLGIWLLPGVSLMAQVTDSLPYETGVIHVARPRLAPYFNVSYRYTVQYAPVKKKSGGAGLFRKNNDTLDRKKLLLVNPWKGDLSEEICRRVHYTYPRADSVKMDSIKLYFHVNKQGKISQLSLAENDHFRDSLKINNWKPQGAHEQVQLEVWRLFSWYVLEKQVQTDEAGQSKSFDPKWKPGGYVRKNKSGKKDEEMVIEPSLRQNFSCELTVYYSSAPLTPYQKETGVRFVAGN